MGVEVNYYNEFDPFAAAWLRELIKAGEIPNGIVDERSIVDVRPDELREYAQCHFFAGIGGWSLSLKLAGWPDDRPVWTGSCPCQPFSSAGNRKGKADSRHLWPTWHGLIRECRPATVFGEQVASAISHGWLDDVYQGLEAENYAVGAAILPACSVGAPHKRDRLYFVGHYSQSACEWDTRGISSTQTGKCGAGQQNGDMYIRPTDASDCVLADAQGRGRSIQQPAHIGQAGGKINAPTDDRSGKHGTAWASGEWIECADGKARLIEPNIRLLANGVSNRLGKLRGYGNAIVPKVAAEFIKSAS
jgi:DNA (cytosine-5)-methyltransferase 1